MRGAYFFRSTFSILVVLILAINVNASDNGNGGRGGDGTNGGNGGKGGNGGNGGNGGFFGGNGGNGGDGGGGKGKNRENLLVNIAPGQIDECEYKALKDACRAVIAKVEERLAETGNLNPAIIQQIFKSELSNYLLSLGSPASQKIHGEYEAVEWKYPDIKDI